MTTETNDTSGTDLYDSLIADAIAAVEPGLRDEPDVDEEEVVVDTAPVDEVVKVAEEDGAADGLKRLTEREAALAAKEKDYDARLNDLKRLTAPDPDKLSLTDLKKLADTDVPGVFKKLGLDQDYIMDVLIAEKLGDKAPPVLKEKLRDYKLKKEIEAIRNERDSERNASNAREYYQKVSNDAREYVSKSLDVKVAPTVSEVAKTDTDFVHNLVLREIDSDARAKVARGETSGDLLTYAEAVANIETLFSKVAAAVKKGVAETTSKKVTTGTPVPPVTRPKADKPKDEVAELEALGLKIGMATYNKGQQAARR